MMILDPINIVGLLADTVIPVPVPGARTCYNLIMIWSMSPCGGRGRHNLGHLLAHLTNKMSASDQSLLYLLGRYVTLCVCKVKCYCSQ